ncbi:MAG: hypothetical protein ACE5FU_01285 [Nitrospinota bacterium]
MIFYVRAFDITQQIINEIGLTFSTLLCGKLLNNAVSIGVIIFLGVFIDIFKGGASGKWEQYKEKFSLKKVKKILFIYLFAILLFYPVETKLLKVESEGNGAVTETAVTPSSFNPFKKYDIEINGFRMPFIIGVWISTFDFIVYHPDYGVLPFVFGSLYSAFVHDPYIIFNNFDLIMASSNLEYIVLDTAENTKRIVLESYMEINHKLASLGGELFKLNGYNNTRSHQFFIDAGIAATSPASEQTKYHGYFGYFTESFGVSGEVAGSPAQAEINIAEIYSKTTPEFADSIEQVIFAIDKESAIPDDYIEKITKPPKAALSALAVIENEITSNPDLELYKRELFVILAGEVRKNIISIRNTLKTSVNADYENMRFIKEFIDKKNTEQDERNADSFFSSVRSWSEYVFKTPIFKLVSFNTNKILSTVIYVMVYLVFLIAKLFYIYIFMKRSIYIGMSLSTIIFSMIKSLIHRDLYINMGTVSEYIMYRLWDIGFLLATLFSYSIPYYLAFNISDLDTHGSFKDTKTMLIMGFGMLIELLIIQVLIKKTQWLFEPKEKPDGSTFVANKEIDNVTYNINNAGRQTGDMAMRTVASVVPGGGVARSFVNGASRIGMGSGRTFK